MLANTSRTRATAFDADADGYAAGRPHVDTDAVSDLIQLCDLAPGAHVLEAGAGTGQLTVALLAAGLHVTAIEPGASMADRLRRLAAGEPGLTVIEDTFERADLSGRRFDAVLSANAWHWVDPSIGLPKLATVTLPHACLGLVWTFFVAADAGVQRRLNSEVLHGELGDLARDPAGYRDAIDASMVAGSAEREASGYVGTAALRHHRRRRNLDVAAYVALLTSFAGHADAGAALGRRIAACGLGPSIEVLDDAHVCVAPIVTVEASARP